MADKEAGRVGRKGAERVHRFRTGHQGRIWKIR